MLTLADALKPKKGAFKNMYVNMVVDTKQNHDSRKTDMKRRSKAVTYKQRKKLKFSNFSSLFLDAYTHVFKSCFVFSFF